MVQLLLFVPHSFIPVVEVLYVRIAPALLSLALAMPAASLSAATLAEKQQPHPIELAQLISKPQAYQGMRVEFDCTFCANCRPV